MYIGAHVRASGGVWKAIDNGVELGCEAVQFFAGSPRTWKPQLYSEKDAARFREARAASPIRFVLIHTIYLINLATTNEDFYEKSVTALVGAVVAAEQLGADAIVTHIGSHQGAGFEAGLARVEAALRSRPRRGRRLPRARAPREHRRRGRHDGRQLRRARGDDRLGRRRPPRRPVPRHGAPLRGRASTCAAPRASRRPSPTSTRPAASTVSSACTSTTRRRRWARTATGTRTSATATSACRPSPSS